MSSSFRPRNPYVLRLLGLLEDIDRNLCNDGLDNLGLRRQVGRLGGVRETRHMLGFDLRLQLNDAKIVEANAKGIEHAPAPEPLPSPADIEAARAQIEAAQEVLRRATPAPGK